MFKYMRIIPFALMIAVIGAGLLGIKKTERAKHFSDTAGLQRSEKVIQEKIARKQAKLDGSPAIPQDPFGYAEFRRLVRPHPEGTTITEMLLAAKKEVERMPELEMDKDAGLWNWEWLGPGNIGGRIRSILLHPTNPDIMWIGGVSGGVWRTNDGGGYWYPMMDFLPSLAVSAMVMDPDDPDILYAATGEGLAGGTPSAGIFKSTDGGANWSQLAGSVDPVHGQYINDLAIHPTNGQILFAATGGWYNQTNQGQVWKSSDGGTSWIPVLQRDVYYFSDVELDPDNPDVVFASSLNGCFRSHSAGANGSWHEMTTGAANALPDIVHRTTFSFGVGNEYVYASCNTPREDHPEAQGEVWRSTDNGLTWDLRSRPYHLGKQGIYGNVIWLEPGSTGNLMIGGLDLHRSLNSGTTWTVMSNWHLYHHGGISAHIDQHVIVPHINYGNFNATVFVGNDGGIQKTILGFATEPIYGWSNLANNLGITQFYHADGSPDGSVILGGTQDNDDLRYLRSQGAQAWYQADTGDGTYNAVDPDNTQTMYAAYIRLAIERTDDGGQNYNWIHDGITDTGDPDQALFIAPFALDKVNPNYLMAGGESIWFTSNRGNNWSRSLGPRLGWPLCSAVEISPVVGSMVTWVGYTDGSIWKTENRGDSWSEVEITNGGYLPDAHIRDIEISQHNPNIVAVVLAGYFNDRVWLTTNGGVTWSLITGSSAHTLPVVGSNCITFHPVDPEWLYLGTDIGLFASEDLGQTWNVTPRYEVNEGPLYVEVSDMFWHSGETLVAVTYGRGLYECRPLVNVFVDITNNGSEDGTLFEPFNTFGEGYYFIGPGSNMIVADGLYDENGFILEKRITVQGNAGESVIIK